MAIAPPPAGLLESKSLSSRRIDEKHTAYALAFGCGTAAARPGRTAARRDQRPLRDGVLLQGAMGASTGISEPVPEEPLPITHEGGRERPHPLGENRAARQPHDRGWALGLSRYDPVQEFDGGDHRQSRRGAFHQATLARPEDLRTRGATAVRDPAGPLGSAGHRHHAREEVK